jgi:hypothetical protein
MSTGEESKYDGAHGQPAEGATFASYLASDSADKQRLAAEQAALVDVSPLDAHNLSLLDQVHPVAWTDPDPDGIVYNMVAIGAGAGE